MKKDNLVQKHSKSVYDPDLDSFQGHREIPKTKIIESVQQQDFSSFRYFCSSFWSGLCYITLGIFYPIPSLLIYLTIWILHWFSLTTVKEDKTIYKALDLRVLFWCVIFITTLMLFLTGLPGLVGEAWIVPFAKSIADWSKVYFPEE